MTPRIWINGKLFDKADAKVSVYDHGLLYGDGIFEGIRVYNNVVFKLREHLERLYEGARSIRLEIPYTPEQLAEHVRVAVQANQKVNGYIRLVVTRGAGNLGIDPRRSADPQVIIIVDDIALYPAELYAKGMEIITAATVRTAPNALNPRVKSLNYLNNIMAKMEATQAGCEEAIMLNHLGEVAECTADNLFLVKHGVLKTPPPNAGILEGITRGTVLDLARTAEIPTQEVALTRHDVYTADEMFLTGTGAEIIAVTKVDSRSIGTGKPGPITGQLRELFHLLVQSGGR